MDRCANCGIATGRCNTIGRRALHDEEAILSVVREWRAPEPIHDSDHICLACRNLAQEVVLQRQPNDESKLVDHSSVCLRCGRSLTTQRVTHQLRRDSTCELRIYNVIREWIMPRSILETSRICHSCWMLADRASIQIVSRPSTSSQPDLEVQAPSVDLPMEQEQPSGIEPEAQPNVLHQESHQPNPTIVLLDNMRAIETENRRFVEFKYC